MSIEEISTVDFIGLNDQRVNLVISDHLGWGEYTDEHLYLLQEKVNSYLKFIESGEMAQLYPNSEGKQVQIEIAFKFKPTDKCQWFLEQLRPILQGAGITLAIDTKRAS